MEYNIWNYVQVPISVIATTIITWWISDRYHKKKNEPDEIFKQNRNDKLASLRDRTGHSFSIFKTEFENVLNKDEIVEQDLIAFKDKATEQLVTTLQHNQKNIKDRWNEYLPWVTTEEISKYTDFFTHMLWLLRIFQQERSSDYDLQEANELCNKIKSISSEFDGISHIISGVSQLSYEDSKKLAGVDDFKSPATQR